ncbi:MAG: hypothetical protein IJW70_10130 [Clostridia bacterium]|nr:hypothetical protein [Clostridia bacterium]
MKKAIPLILLVVVCICLVSCKNSVSNPCDLASGTYYASGDYQEFMVPYLQLDFEDYSFSMGMGAIISYAEHGTFTVKDNRLTTTTPNGKAVFEIQNDSTLILIEENYSWWEFPENLEFVYHRDNGNAQ